MRAAITLARQSRQLSKVQETTSFQRLAQRHHLSPGFKPGKLEPETKRRLKKAVDITDMCVYIYTFTYTYTYMNIQTYICVYVYVYR